MNVISFLGFVMTNSNGETLWSLPLNLASGESEVDRVSCTTVPGFIGSFAMGRAEGEILAEEVMFEPYHSTLDELSRSVKDVNPQHFYTVATYH